MTRAPHESGCGEGSSQHPGYPAFSINCHFCPLYSSRGIPNPKEGAWVPPLSRAWEFTVEQVGGDTGRNLPTEAHKQATREFRWENPQAVICAISGARTQQSQPPPLCPQGWRKSLGPEQSVQYGMRVREARSPTQQLQVDRAKW